MKKKTIILAILICICFCGSACAQNADEKTSAAMAEFDWVMDEIGRLPGKIDEDICGGDMVSYRSHMTELAQNIITANTIIKDVKLYYPIDLWTIYNRISRNPVCGAGTKAAEDAFGVADISRISNDEKMGRAAGRDAAA